MLRPVCTSAGLVQFSRKDYNFLSGTEGVRKCKDRFIFYLFIKKTKQKKFFS